VPAEKTRSKAYGEAIGDEPALFGRDKVAELVYENGKAKRKECECDI
jgi:hypothetical protein